MRGEDLTRPLGQEKTRRWPSSFLLVPIISCILLAGVVGNRFYPLEKLLFQNEGPLNEKDPSAASKPGLGPRDSASLQRQLGTGTGVYEPISNLIEMSEHGPIPKISSDGVRALDAYARRPEGITLTGPRIALIVSGLGLSSEMSARALRALPQDVSLGLSTLAVNGSSWMKQARVKGHEVLLQLPKGTSAGDGRRAFNVSSSVAERQEFLTWTLSRTSNYIGLINSSGEDTFVDDEVMKPVLTELQKRGLMFMDDGSSASTSSRLIAQETQTAFVGANLVLDQELKIEAIKSQLQELEKISRTEGLAIGSASAYPLTLQVLENWVKTLSERGITLIPVSAAING
ncbi:divergent polysaccharide deacetylase family protein [Flexibacterium corallicola]|uniref:divergent polysaccharide deacetylase family protein n=1 Tax=Flexibacterium corallicola TaxID=3037259 RepID=UPI00286F52B6|nr:divergent polysaccharide deacetylase family protein [Pseudovibrio sp. M1P-2-3]